MTLDEYESKLPQKYDREKFVLSSEKYNLILECLNTEKGIKAPGGARFKHWEKAIFRKTTEVCFHIHPISHKIAFFRLPFRFKHINVKW
jgi:hypothetical protein